MFFPRAIMPLTIKKNAPGSVGAVGRVRLLADNYNTHDQELKSIEEYLGTNKTYPVAGIRMVPEAPPVASNNTDLFSRIASIIERLNSFSDPSGGASSSSGFVVSGKKVQFPSSAQATFLTSFPDGEDRTIHVKSTLGFPEQGIISILNKVDVASLSSGTWKYASQSTFVEWIKYGRKTGSTFENCQRGYMGTTGSSHYPDQGINNSLNGKNSRDFYGDPDVLPLAASPASAVRRYTAWKDRDSYDFPMVNLSGDKLTLTWRVMRKAGTFRVSPNETDSYKFVESANLYGILGQRQDGTYYLISKTPSLAAIGQLSWEEGNGFVGSMIDNKGINRIATPISWNWNYRSVPVFQGRLSLQYGNICLGGNFTVPISSARISQTCEGTLYCFSGPDQGLYYELVSLIGFHSFYVPSQVSLGILNDKSEVAQ